MSKPSWLSSLQLHFSSARPALTPAGKSATALSSSIATTKSESSGWKRPSICLQLAFLALAGSALLSLETNETTVDPEVPRLLARSWQWVDPAPCENLLTGKFYEIESEGETTEFYTADPEKFLAPSAPWPEPPALCREIPKPSFIQEVK